MFYICLYDFHIIVFVLYAIAIAQSCSLKVVFKNFAKFTKKHLCWSLLLSAASNFMRIETTAKVFSCEILQNF